MKSENRGGRGLEWGASYAENEGSRAGINHY